MQVALQQVEGCHVQLTPANSSPGSQTDTALCHDVRDAVARAREKWCLNGGPEPMGHQCPQPRQESGAGAGTVGLARWGWHCEAGTVGLLQLQGSKEREALSNVTIVTAGLRVTGRDV